MNFKVITYNIRKLYEEKDPCNNWNNRKKSLVGLILKHKPDILCIQEDHPEQIDYVKSKLKGYVSYGFYNESLNEDIAGEANTIFFDSKKFRLIQKGRFWLSNTSNKESKLEGQSKHNRTVSFVKLSFRGKDFYIFNTHFDHLSKSIQAEEARILVDEVNKKIDKADYIICGDFNGTLYSEHVQLLKEKFTLINSNIGGEKTIMDWSGTHLPRECIDFIFSSFKKVSVKIDKSTYISSGNKTRTPSDHFPIITILEI